MTGLYPHQSGIIDNCDVGGSRQEYLPNSAYTWLDAMVGSGRKTGYFGKWHLGLPIRWWILISAALRVTV